MMKEGGGLSDENVDNIIMFSWSMLESEAPDEGQWFPTMSWITRIQGFALCWALGFFANVVAWVALAAHNYVKYSLLSSVGNVMSMMSTVMLMGPLAQCKRMFDPIRRETTIVYLASIAATISAALVWHSAPLCALFTIVQYAALVWYSLSYVPYGRELARSVLAGCTRAAVPA